MSRGLMTMRAQVKRSVVADDAWGRPAQVSTLAVREIPCRVWVDSAVLVIDGNKQAAVERVKAMFPAGSDIRAGDSLVAVTDRRGAVLFDGPLFVRDPVRRPRHIESELTRHA